MAGDGPMDEHASGLQPAGTVPQSCYGKVEDKEKTKRKRLSLFARELKWRSSSWHGSSALRLPTSCYGGSFVIDPNGRWYRMWSNMMFLWSIYSVFYTPFAFCFFRGLPEHLLDLECAQLVFLADVAVHFFLAYQDPHTHRVVYDKQRIALRYIKGSFALDMLGCFPWDAIYKFTGRMEMVRYLVWLRLYRARKIQGFFKKMEKDIRISYLFTRIVKLVTVELYCTHTAACIFYYLATTLHQRANEAPGSGASSWETAATLTSGMSTC
ncbi:hypothetical protein ACQ4PT_040816 [Festuca glaucescens]